jgi:hypothetical protein
VIEELLYDASEEWFPPTPLLAERVRARLPARPDPHGRLWRRVLVVALAALVIAGGALAATLLDLVPGVRLRHAERLPSATLTQPLAAGRPVTLAEAERIVPFTILLPAGLAERPHYFLDRDAAGAAVFTAVYGSGTRAELVLTQWRGGPVLFDKLLGYQARTEYVDVGGAPGIWIEGPEHAVFYLGLAGKERRLAGRLAGNVLVWQRNAVSYRLEADVGRQRALELAASLRAE